MLQKHIYSSKWGSLQSSENQVGNNYIHRGKIPRKTNDHKSHITLNIKFDQQNI